MVSLPGAIAFQGFSRSPRHGGEALWLVISVDFGRTDIPVHFSLLTGSEVDGRKKAAGPNAVVSHANAVLGMVRFLGAPYIIVVTAATVVGTAGGASNLHRVDSVEFLPFQRSPEHSTLTKQQQRDESHFLNMMASVFRTQSFYFGQDYEITHSAQRIAELRASDPSVTGPETWRRADDRFLWNAQFLTEFAKARDELHGVDEWITPVICGFIDCKPVSFGSDVPRVSLVIISRRSRHRQGTRFYRRGIDAENNVANFVETEELVLSSDGAIASYVQVRGSIPVYWSQEPTLKYTPKALLTPSMSEEKAAFACAGHMKSLNHVYNGEVVAVNLIDMKGDQQVLGKAYAAAVTRAVANGAQVTYVWFDFHKECRKMRYDRLSLLMDQVDGHMKAMGLFRMNSLGMVLSTQRGVIRTNCMDNLDRTNVVQSLFGRHAVLAALGLRPKSARATVLDSGFPEFEPTFKAMWADNADVLSNLYSGTGALKTDFTRTGKRTLAGALQDGWNSISRYGINNFSDARRQDAWDLFLGLYAPARGASYDVTKSPLRAAAREHTLCSALVGLLLVASLVVGTTVVSHGAVGSQKPLLSQLTAGVMASVTLISIVGYMQLSKGVGPLKKWLPRPKFTAGSAPSVPRPTSPAP